MDMVNCKGVCDICTFYNPNAEFVKCAKAQGIHLNTPLSGVPYEHALAIHSVQLQSNTSALHYNNQLRERDERRNMPNNKLMVLLTVGVIYVTVTTVWGQLLLWLVSML